MIKIAADIQGADRSPSELIDGVITAAEHNPDLFVYLCGKKDELTELLAARGYNGTRIQTVDAPEVITNSDKPVAAVRSKKNSSLVKGIELCKTGEAAAFATCGATGALLIAATFLLGKAAKSPALVCALKKPNGSPFCIADCGANVDCRVERIADFARVAVAYMKSVGIARPRVAQLSNGAEDEKGSGFTKQAHEILSRSGLCYIGNVEGTNVLCGDADVVVCDGFSGNVLLKSIEGSVKSVISEAKNRMIKSCADAASLDVLDELFREYDYTTQGGAYLLGFDSPIVKGHGAATAETVYHIIDCAYALAASDITAAIKKEFAVNRQAC